MHIVNVLIIIASIVYLYNHTTLIYDLEILLQKKLGTQNELRKPFSCSSCMIFWITFLYLLFHESFLISFSIGLLSHLLSRLVNKIITLIINVIEKIN